MLIAARFLHIAALIVLFGVALFPLYAGRDAPIKRLRLTASLLALVSGVAWLMLTTKAITGSVSFDAISLVVRNTDFGAWWLARLIVLAAIVPLSLLRLRGWMACLVFAAITFALVSLAGTGHAQVGEPRWLHFGADALHLIAAGAWIGGLLPLAVLLSREHDVEAALLRFSAMGMAAVAVLIASGLINAWFVLSGPGALFTSPYGNVLLVKLALFAGMLALAARNRFLLMPRLAGANGKTRATLRQAAIFEQILGLGVLGAVALLGTLEPG